MTFTKELIAPCGINCGVCYAFLRTKNKCDGCLVDSDRKIGHCSKCGIKNCAEHDDLEFTYCFECPKYPCKRMKNMEKRYTGTYHLSLFGNLQDIKIRGLDPFIASESKKWCCTDCGGILCVHKSACPVCGKEYR